MVRELYTKFKPVQRGLISEEEVQMIKEELHLKSMDALQLRNLRDFVVLYFSVQVDKDSSSTEDVMSGMDKCSAICAVIDDVLFNMEEEV